MIKINNNFQYILFISILLLNTYAVNAGVEQGSNEFSLVSGNDVEVCEAYLERLNTTKFSEMWPPYCDRPESVGMHGFNKLNRVNLNEYEIYDVYGKVSSYELTKNQKLFSTDDELGPDKEGSIKSIRRKIKHNRLTAWRYEPKVDIDNDGQLDNVVLWRQQLESSCGIIGESKSLPNFVAYIFNESNSQIDEKKTLEVFGDREQVRPYAPTLKRFRRLNDESSIGIFKYKGTVYFDTFPGGKEPDTNIDLKVYLRKNSRTIPVCEYRWNNRIK